MTRTEHIRRDEGSLWQFAVLREDFIMMAAASTNDRNSSLLLGASRRIETSLLAALLRRGFVGAGSTRILAEELQRLKTTFCHVFFHLLFGTASPLSQKSVQSWNLWEFWSEDRTS